MEGNVVGSIAYVSGHIYAYSYVSLSLKYNILDTFLECYSMQPLKGIYMELL